MLDENDLWVWWGVIITLVGESSVVVWVPLLLLS